MKLHVYINENSLYETRCLPGRVVYVLVEHVLSLLYSSKPWRRNMEEEVGYVGEFYTVSERRDE